MKKLHKKILYSILAAFIGILLLTGKFYIRAIRNNHKIDSIESSNLINDTNDIINFLDTKENFVVNFGELSAEDSIEINKYGIEKAIYFKSYKKNKNFRNRKFIELKSSKNLYINSVPIKSSNIEYFNINCIQPNFIKDYYIDFIKDSSYGTLIVNFNNEVMKMEFYNQLDIENTIEYIKKIKNDDIAYIILWGLILATILVGINKYLY